jgi:transcriptional regulator with XRE-family HTH domain
MNQNLGQWLRKHRDARGLTQQELANAVQTDPGSVSRWERGKSVPNLRQLCEICRLLDGSADEALALRAPPKRKRASGAR